MFVYLVHNCTTHNNQKVEANQMYNGKWKNTKNALSTHNGILFSLKVKEILICVIIQIKLGALARWNEPSTKENSMCFHLDEECNHQKDEQHTTTKNWETEGRRIQFCEIKDILEIGFYKSLNVLNATQWYT